MFLRRLRGGAQSSLFLCDDGHPYVVKFQNNAQHLRVLADEWLAAGIAMNLGLPVPPCRIVHVDKSLIDATKELTIDFGDHRTPCAAGLQFGSRLVGGILPGRVVDYLPEAHLSEVSNLNDFHGALVLDKWTCNADGRQAVFSKKHNANRYSASFIDQGHCFNGGEWIWRDAPLRGIYARNIVYRKVQGWGSFEPWLDQVEHFSIGTLWDIAATIPPEWYAEDRFALERLIEVLYQRRGGIRELISEFRASSREPFPHWVSESL